MSIDTHLDLPSFNVVKYAVVFIVFDIIVRRSLLTILIFFRRQSLHNGRPVPLQARGIDRYNLQGHAALSRSATSLFLFLLTISVYAVEFFLEFSANSSAQKRSAPGFVNILNATHKACSVEQVTHYTTLSDMINLADSCIDIDYEKSWYKFFRYEWERTESGSQRPLCVRAPDNILTEGNLIYHQKDLDLEARHFTGALKASSFGAKVDNHQAVVAMQVLPEHILGLQRTTIDADTFLTGPLIISVLDSPKMKIRCYGQVYGRVGEGQTKAEVKFCSSSESYFVFVSGSGLITEDADSLTSRPWKVLVACSLGRVVANYSKGIDSSVPFASEARAMLLGSVFDPDERSIQRYAALHSNCKDVVIPYNASSRNQSIPNAKVLTTVHVSVEKWALVMLLACSIVLGSMGCVLNSIANWKNMPKHVFGERALAKRWCREKETQCKDEVEREPNISGKFNIWNLRRKLFPKNNPLYLSVFVGDLQDDLCIIRRETVVTRDKSKNFVDIDLDKHHYQDWDLESVPPPIGLPGVNIQAKENL